ncbi:alpha/beta hydrolase [Sphingosinicella sp. LHD-64]|uniref:alpha/beta fold hydrolase n=1 Tax=Sphingosinicella sp. LHD-64 TaxID=3072139 RepID=UPI00280F3F69|nr:alpha/beta hydrolase [Sphingosinicella sp. LHD-64]MDQ8757585.1 alpha/beta hydrolase [Sphingosinicella sp. LHD-64]
MAAPGADPWFVRAIADQPVERRIDVAGAAIELLTWQGDDGPGLLLVHGAGAHADWWRPTAPQLVRAAGQVAAFSFSGMGGSDWRDAYSIDLHADELMAAAEAGGLFEGGRRPFVAAHSFGCLPAMLAMERWGERFAGLILIDLYLPPPGRPPARPRERKLRRYASLEEGLGRFLLAPPQDCPYPFMVDFVARRTLRHTGMHWTWCTDPDGGVPVAHDVHRARLRQLTVPLTLLRGECSRLVDVEVAGHLREVAPAGTRFIEIPDADHHILLDRPLALVAALRCLLEGP